MVYIDGVKYACERCIRGHRVTGCNHTNMPLTMIKPKGRPATQCQHCRELRKNKQHHTRCKCGSGTNGKHSSSCPCAMDKELCTCPKNKSNKRRTASNPPPTSKLHLTSAGAAVAAAAGVTVSGSAPISIPTCGASASAKAQIQHNRTGSSGSVNSIASAFALHDINSSLRDSSPDPNTPSSPFASATFSSSPTPSISILRSASSASLGSLGSRRSHRKNLASRGTIIHPSSSASMSAKINVINSMELTPSPPESSEVNNTFTPDRSSTPIPMFFPSFNPQAEDASYDLLSSLDSLPSSNNNNNSNDNNSPNLNGLSIHDGSSSINDVSSFFNPSSASLLDLGFNASTPTGHTSSSMASPSFNSLSGFMTSSSSMDGYVSDVEPPLSMSYNNTGNNNNNNNNNKFIPSRVFPRSNSNLALATSLANGLADGTISLRGNSSLGKLDTDVLSHSGHQLGQSHGEINPSSLQHMDDFGLLSPSDNYEMLPDSSVFQALDFGVPEPDSPNFTLDSLPQNHRQHLQQHNFRHSPVNGALSSPISDGIFADSPGEIQPSVSLFGNSNRNAGNGGHRGHNSSQQYYKEASSSSSSASSAAGSTSSATTPDSLAVEGMTAATGSSTLGFPYDAALNHLDVSGELLRSGLVNELDFGHGAAAAAAGLPGSNANSTTTTAPCTISGFNSTGAMDGSSNHANDTISPSQLSAINPESRMTFNYDFLTMGSNV